MYITPSKNSTTLLPKSPNTHRTNGSNQATASALPRYPHQPPRRLASTKKGTQRIQAIAGTFLYYTRGVDPTILPALNKLASEQAAPTTDTETKAKMLMDYLYTSTPTQQQPSNTTPATWYSTSSPTPSTSSSPKPKVAPLGTIFSATGHDQHLTSPTQRPTDQSTPSAKQ
jgi:hypothetical protein